MNRLTTPCSGCSPTVQILVKVLFTVVALLIWIFAIAGLSAAWHDCTKDEYPYYDVKYCSQFFRLQWFYVSLEFVTLVAMMVIAFLNILYTTWSLLLFLAMYLILASMGVMLSENAVSLAVRGFSDTRWYSQSYRYGSYSSGGYYYTYYEKDASLTVHAIGIITLTLFNFIMIVLLAIDGGRTQSKIKTQQVQEAQMVPQMPYQQSPYPQQNRSNLPNRPGVVNQAAQPSNIYHYHFYNKDGETQEMTRGAISSMQQTDVDPSKTGASNAV